MKEKFFLPLYRVRYLPNNLKINFHYKNVNIEDIQLLGDFLSRYDSKAQQGGAKITVSEAQVTQIGPYYKLQISYLYHQEQDTVYETLASCRYQPGLGDLFAEVKLYDSEEDLLESDIINEVTYSDAHLSTRNTSSLSS